MWGDWGDPAPLENMVYPFHKLTCPLLFCPKKHCFCNFHAVFDDFDHNATLTQ